MRNQSSQRPAQRWLPAVMLLASFVWVDSATAADRQKQVLILHSVRRDAEISVVVDRELPRLLDKGLGQGQDYYAEYIDAARFTDPAYQLAFRDFLRLKYRGQQFDVVVAMQEVASEFVDKNRNQLFPNVPVVFFTNSPRPRTPNSTNVIALLNLKSAMLLAMALQPDTRHVFIVSGAGPRERRYENLAKAQLKSLDSQVDVTYLSGLPTRELEARLSSLPRNSVVYFLLVYRDGAGQNFYPLDYLDRVVAIANAPTYCWVDSAMGHGVVGGSLVNQMGEVESVATTTLRVLRGERADDIPTSTPNLMSDQIDWRQLQRWGISESHIPPGTLVRFRSTSVWDRYKTYIVMAVSLLLVQAALIAGLLLQASRRRQAEKHLLASQRKLSASHARISDLGRRLIQAQEGERSHIARELHDDISQQIALLSIEVHTLIGSAWPSPRDKKPLRELMERVESLAKSVHDLSHRLYPAKLRLLGLVAGIKSLQRDFSQPDVRVVFTHEIGAAVIPHDVTLCLFRVVQEGLTNAIKHSGAREISVNLTDNGDGLALTIVDDGSGFDVDTRYGKGLGLISMKERLEAVGGSLAIQSAPGSGTRIEASVALSAAKTQQIMAV